MPGKIKVKVLAGRNLPVMDRAGDTTDAFVEIKFGGITHKTDVCRKSLNPHWNSTEWYRFEVDESELQDEPLQLRLMDHDTYSANDAIGKVVISLAPLLSREPAPNTKAVGTPHSGAVMSGWIPVFDTMHGIRGELNVIVKVELFADFNKYKTSSCGVQFFHCPMVPPGYRATSIHGFVEELVVNDDPEYQWIDKIRTPRASNEARQAAFIKLSNQVQRLVGLKASELGANAVVGYQQTFDLEGETGVVARAIGTAISIVALPTPSQPTAVPPCSQQQLKKYLDILASDNESVTDLNQYFQTHQEELQKMVHILHPKTSSNFLDEQEIDDEEKGLEVRRQSSIKSYTDSVSIYQDDYIYQKSFKHIAEDQNELNRFLARDEEDEEECSGPLKRIKKMRPSSFFSKRFGRAKKTKQSDDQISIKSNSSDTSRISLSDFRNEFRKFKRLKKPKFKRTLSADPDDGIGMASILARSVIHAHTSLACIAETQDSEHSPSSTLRKTSESEPTIHLSDEDRSKLEDAIADEDNVNDLKVVVPEIHFGSLKNIKGDMETQPRERKLSESCPNTPVSCRAENLLKLPGEVGYFGSISSALSGESSEMYSSSDEDDESSEIRTDTERSVETTSSVVQTVLKQEVDPVFLAQMEKKLSILESNVPPEPKEPVPAPSIDPTGYGEACKSVELEGNVPRDHKSIEPIPTPSSNPHHHHFKFHNPFSHRKIGKSLSEPSSPVDKPSFVYRSSMRLKSQISKFSKSNMIKSLSHYSLTPKKKHPAKKPLSQPGSASDVASKANSHETVLGSPFLSYVDLLTMDKGILDVPPKQKADDQDHMKIHMYIGSEPVSRTSVSAPVSPKVLEHREDHHEIKGHKKDKHSAMKSTGLLHTAMETILIDKVNYLLIPTSPDQTDTKEKTFFADVNERLEKFEQSQNKERDTHEVDNSNRKLVRQNSVHSSSENLNCNVAKMSNEPITISDRTHRQVRKPTPVLQHLHPIASGSIHPKLSHLETIPSLPESSSIDREFSLEESDDAQSSTIDCTQPVSEAAKAHDTVARRSNPIIAVEGDTDTNSTPSEGRVVCDNSHAACRGSVRREKEREREKDKCDKEKGSPKHARHESYGGREQAAAAAAGAAAGPAAGAAAGPAAAPAPGSLQPASTPVGIHRRSSDSDLSVTPKGGSLNASVGNAGAGGGGAILKTSMNSNNIDMLEYPFLTMSEYPTGFIVHIGGTVCARSVKLADAGEPGARAAWWAELRTELRAHARALRCNAVLAYAEAASICEDVCVLSVSGTAAVINLDCDFGADVENIAGAPEPCAESCGAAHAPYAAGAAEGGYRARLRACAACGRPRVPAVMLATCAKPRALRAHARATAVTAVAARLRRAPPQSEPGARDISDQLPFLEYELHKLLLAKLRMQGANALFSLRTQIAMGERCVVALASGIAYKLVTLPPPVPPRIKASENDKEAAEMQKALLDTFAANKSANGYDIVLTDIASSVLPEVDNEDAPLLDLCSDRDACVLELDEAEDVETARALSVRRSQMPVLTQYLRTVPRANPYAFAQVWRSRFLGAPGAGGAAGAGGVAGACAAAERAVSRALDGVQYKLRTLAPAALAAPTFQVDIAEDEIHLVVSGAAIPLQDPNKLEHASSTEEQSQAAAVGASGDADEDIFTLDEDKEEEGSARNPESADDKSSSQAAQPPAGAVALTPLPALSGARRQRRVCALQLLFVRETTAVRELGGLSGFLHTFMCEVLAIVRAHAAALGGNALTSFYINQLMLQDNAHKNQGQCLLSVGGDVVHVTY